MVHSTVVASQGLSLAFGPLNMLQNRLNRKTNCAAMVTKAAYVMNVFSGMLIMLADSSRYLNAPTFAPKIALIVIGAAAVLYFSLSERLWKVSGGEDAPAGAKWVAALVLISWTGVIMGGRLISYI